MPIPTIIAVKIDRTGLPAMKKREINNVQKEAFKAMGEYWVRHIMPRHFADGAEARYNFAPRSKDHMRRKWFHHQTKRPLVYSGQFESEVNNQFNQRIQATSKRVTIRLTHHKVHEKVRRDLAKLDTSGNELKQLMSVFRNKIVELTKMSKARVTTRIRRR